MQNKRYFDTLRLQVLLLYRARIFSLVIQGANTSLC